MSKVIIKKRRKKQKTKFVTSHLVWSNKDVKIHIFDILDALEGICIIMHACLFSIMSCKM